ncbi:uncharacterized protein VTP21DRAFT_7881 [Calcarisporiella thermophila]|uniref:uncharacterized protein n=1 Tax=Calcarisporiella thermophila TaxID=911321 RepID=UPI003742B8BD
MTDSYLQQDSPPGRRRSSIIDPLTSSEHDHENIRQQAAAKLALAARKRQSYQATAELQRARPHSFGSTSNGHVNISKAQQPPLQQNQPNSQKRMSLPLSPRLPSYYYEESEVNRRMQEQLQQTTEKIGVGGDVNENSRRSKRNSLVDPTYLDSAASVVQTPESQTTILDVYDFSPSFKTQDLQNIFSVYEGMRGGYRIKWIHDTRALILFEHPATAKQAYLANVGNPVAKVRPYTGTLDFLNNSRRDPSSKRHSIDILSKRVQDAFDAQRQMRSIHGNCKQCQIRLHLDITNDILLMNQQ